ncbi:hypothetical protein AMATHDRAFT_69261 [Amanita thiersii Skay4041]|uniref:Uncharacterized protein n=1 Tax=Amanita thiersii Skay4041 TaxID=703135 RepID=A0A2A9NGE1_9AGAR|nr:hypothetical protein AMATHDRAFT_69261 [Amanita thiersii Skay4041]
MRSKERHISHDEARPDEPSKATKPKQMSLNTGTQQPSSPVIWATNNESPLALPGSKLPVLLAP